MELLLLLLVGGGVFYFATRGQTASATDTKKLPVSGSPVATCPSSSLPPPSTSNTSMDAIPADFAKKANDLLDQATKAMGTLTEAKKQSLAEGLNSLGLEAECAGWTDAAKAIYAEVDALKKLVTSGSSSPGGTGYTGSPGLGMPLAGAPIVSSPAPFKLGNFMIAPPAAPPVAPWVVRASVDWPGLMALSPKDWPAAWDLAHGTHWKYGLNDDAETVKKLSSADGYPLPTHTAVQDLINKLNAYRDSGLGGFGFDALHDAAVQDLVVMRNAIDNGWFGAPFTDLTVAPDA